jgi:MFS family permease
MGLLQVLLKPFKNLQQVKDRFGYNTLVILFLVYWSQGFKTLSFLATTLFAKDSLKLDPGTAQLVKTLTITAWLVKPIYGFLTDNFPIFGYNRKSYLFLMGLLGIVSMLSVAMHDNMYLAIFALVLSELSQAFSDVIADAIMVERSRNDEAGSSLLQSFSWSVMGFGAIIGSLLGGFLLERYSPSTVIAMNSLSPFLLMISSIYLEEQEINPRGIREQLRSLIAGVKQPIVYKSLIFVILRGSCPRFSELYYYFLIDVLKLTPLFISSLGVFGYATMIFAGYLYHNFLKEKQYRDILCQGQAITAGLYLVDLALVLQFYQVLGVPGWTFVLGGEIAGTIIDFCFISMPILVLGAHICPKGIEGTFFSLFTSVYNIGGSISGVFGGYLIEVFDVKTGDYSIFWLLVVIQIFFKLIPLFFLKLLPSHKHEEKESELEMVIEKDIEEPEVNLSQIFSGHSSLIHS